MTIRQIVTKWIQERHEGAEIFEAPVQMSLNTFDVYIHGVGTVRIRVDRDSRIGKEFISYQLPKEASC